MPLHLRSKYLISRCTLHAYLVDYRNSARSDAMHHTLRWHNAIPDDAHHHLHDLGTFLTPLFLIAFLVLALAPLICVLCLRIEVASLTVHRHHRKAY